MNTNTLVLSLKVTHKSNKFTGPIQTECCSLYYNDPLTSLPLFLIQKFNDMLVEKVEPHFHQLKEISFLPIFDPPFPLSTLTNTSLDQHHSYLKEPIFQWIEENHAFYLGIPFWTLMIVLPYLTDHLFQFKCTLIDHLEVYSKILLIYQGEHLTAINVRKRLILQGYLDLKEEQRWLHIILLSHSKSHHAWQYQTWLLKKTVLFLTTTTNTLPSSSFCILSSLEQLWKTHWTWLQTLLNLHSNTRNYYLWTFVLILFQTFQSSKCMSKELWSQIKSDLVQYVHLHPSNLSAQNVFNQGDQYFFRLDTSS